MATHWRAPKLLTRIFCYSIVIILICAPLNSSEFTSAANVYWIDWLLNQLILIWMIYTCCFGLLNICVPGRPGVVSRPCTENLNDCASMTRCGTDTRVKALHGPLRTPQSVPHLHSQIRASRLDTCLRRSLTRLSGPRHTFLVRAVP